MTLSTACFHLSLVFVTAAGAAVVPSLSLEQMVDRSEHIVHGRVLRSWSSWDQNRRFIWTHHQIRVTDRLAGPSSATVIASEPGGTVDGVSMRVSGAVPFSTGEEVVLFLYRTPLGYLRATGHAQGKYFVAGEDSTGKRVRTALTRAENPGGGGIDEFKARVRSLVSRRKAAK
ncbi:MAG: hypothetical protein WD696_15300 [Bryobacteraceae bacterium]